MALVGVYVTLVLARKQRSDQLADRAGQMRDEARKQVISTLNENLELLQGLELDFRDFQRSLERILKRPNLPESFVLQFQQRLKGLSIDLRRVDDWRTNAKKAEDLCRVADCGLQAIQEIDSRFRKYNGQHHQYLAKFKEDRELFKREFVQLPDDSEAHGGGPSAQPGSQQKL